MDQDSQQRETSESSPLSSFSLKTPPAKPSSPSSSSSWFAADPSKAYYEKFSLIWAPISLFILLVGVLGTPLYKYCDRNSYLIITILGCLPGIIIPLVFPAYADRDRPYVERFWVKATIWIIIFDFYGNYFWTHYFYHLLGAQFLFDSYRFNDVPLVNFTATFFYFTVYFNFITILLRRLTFLTSHLPHMLRTILWSVSICALSYATALFEALSVQHFPLYTYTERDAFLKIGSVVYALYFIVGFPMFFSLDEDYNDAHAHDHQRQPPSSTSTFTRTPNRISLYHTCLNAFAATAIVTLLLDLWRLSLGSIYQFHRASSIPLPFLYQQKQHNAAQTITPTVESCMVHLPITVSTCVQHAKKWSLLRAAEAAAQVAAALNPN